MESPCQAAEIPVLVGMQIIAAAMDIGGSNMGSLSKSIAALFCMFLLSNEVTVPRVDCGHDWFATFLPLLFRKE